MLPPQLLEPRELKAVRPTVLPASVAAPAFSQPAQRQAVQVAMPHAVSILQAPAPTVVTVPTFATVAPYPLAAATPTSHLSGPAARIVGAIPVKAVATATPAPAPTVYWSGQAPVMVAGSPVSGCTVPAAAPQSFPAVPPARVTWSAPTPSSSSTAPPRPMISPIELMPVMAPSDILDGFPTPEQTELRRLEAERSLEEQFLRAEGMLQRKHQTNLDFLRMKNEQGVRQAVAAIDHQLLVMELELQQHLDAQLLAWNQAAMQRRIQVDQQAGALTLELVMRQKQEELAVLDFEVQRRFFEAARSTLPAEEPGGPFSQVHEVSPTRSSRAPMEMTRPPMESWQESFLIPNQSFDRASNPRSPANGQVSGTLTVTVRAASGLPTEDRGFCIDCTGGTSPDIIVEVAVGGQVRKTPAARQAKELTWERKNQFTFKVGSEERLVHLEVKSVSGVPVGLTTVDFRQIPEGQLVRKAEKLEGGRAKLEFELRFDAN